MSGSLLHSALFLRTLFKVLPCAALAVLLALTGCSLVSKVNPFGGGEEEPLVVTVTGDSLMNNGNAASVVLYPLTSPANFQRTPIETFWQNDRQALAEELAGNPQQVFLYPSQEKQVELDLEDQVRYLGIAANLRMPEPGQWRRSFPLQEVADSRITVQVETNRLTVHLHPEE